MTDRARALLDEARGLIASGEEHYRQAAVKINAAQKEGASIRDAADLLGRSERWVVAITTWNKTPAKSTQGTEELPFSEPKGDVAKRHARSVLRDADDVTLAEIVASLPAEKVEAVARAAHNQQIENIRASAAVKDESLTGDDYERAAERMTEARAGAVEMQQLFVALSQLRVAGVKHVVSRASAADRRRWVERLPEEIALLQLALDLCKTTRLEAVR